MTIIELVPRELLRDLPYEATCHMRPSIWPPLEMQPPRGFSVCRVPFPMLLLQQLPTSGVVLWLATEERLNPQPAHPPPASYPSAGMTPSPANVTAVASTGLPSPPGKMPMADGRANSRRELALHWLPLDSKGRADGATERESVISPV